MTGSVRKLRSGKTEILRTMVKQLIVQKNRAVSEVESQGSRHRRRSVPSFASSLLSGRGRREGSVDPLLEGFQSDGGDSGGRNSNSTFHRSVSRGDFDAMDR